MILSDRDIKLALKQGKISIDPFEEKYLQPASVDLHLDRHFLVFDTVKNYVIDPKKPMDEMMKAPKRVQELLGKTFSETNILPVTEESEKLAAVYMSRNILPPKYTDDARHVAVCTVAQIEYLVSWNFKHLVNVDREKGFNAVNLLQGYRTIRIINPLELIYGNQEKSL